MMVSNRNLVFQWSIFRRYVNFREGILVWLQAEDAPFNNIWHSQDHRACCNWVRVAFVPNRCAIGINSEWSYQQVLFTTFGQENASMSINLHEFNLHVFFLPADTFWTQIHQFAYCFFVNWFLFIDTSHHSLPFCIPHRLRLFKTWAGLGLTRTAKNCLCWRLEQYKMTPHGKGWKRMIRGCLLMLKHHYLICPSKLWSWWLSWNSISPERGDSWIQRGCCRQDIPQEVKDRIKKYFQAGPASKCKNTGSPFYFRRCWLAVCILHHHFRISMDIDGYRVYVYV